MHEKDLFHVENLSHDNTHMHRIGSSTVRAIIFELSATLIGWEVRLVTNDTACIA